MNDTANDSQLLQASLAGSKDAFGTVVRRYQTLVCAVTYSATGDVGTSEELAQETFLRAWRNLRQLEDPGKFRAWLCTIARNLANTSARNGRKDVICGAGPLEEATTIAATAPGPDQMAFEKERQEIVWAAVGRIPLKYREPLVLFYRRQQSVSEVATDLGLSDEAVRQRLHRGRQLIKTEVSSLVEETLIRSGPGKAFAVAVVAALPAMITPPASAAVAGVAAKGAPAAKTLLAAGLAGAILGSILGLLGGIFGVWRSIKNTKSSGERRFMIRLTVLFWVMLFVLIGVPLTLTLAGIVPKWFYWGCFAAFFVLLMPLIFWGNAHQQKIQIREGTYRPCTCAPGRITPRGVYASFGGAIFGATMWLLILASLARDWVSVALIVVCDLIIFYVASAACARKPQRCWPAALAMLCAIVAVTLAAVNIRWHAWMHAYRQSSAYNPTNDVSLRTINLIAVCLYLAVTLFVAWSYVRARKHGDQQDDQRDA